MPKSTIDLVKALVIQLNQFIKLSTAVGPELQGAELAFSVSLCYSRLRFSINQSQDLYLQYTLQQEGPSGAGQAECYCHDPNKIEALKKHFEPLAGGSEGTSSMNTSGKFKYTETLGKYLTIAESIATPAYLCTAGDDYRPGYFSEIAIQAEGITLRQINHMNSRSLSHKQDYSLRDLEFFIPFKPSTEQGLFVSHGDDYIGIMRVRFSDRSSQNKKMCGDMIRDKIEEEKRRFR